MAEAPDKFTEAEVRKIILLSNLATIEANEYSVVNRLSPDMTIMSLLQAACNIAVSYQQPGAMPSELRSFLHDRVDQCLNVSERIKIGDN